ncbi:MAG TPA: SpoIIE family protein phosphatase [Bacteroidota bacterium]|nr:SpoIIE family protein phosphatase [Bacteroidota bacterium]
MKDHNNPITQEIGNDAAAGPSASAITKSLITDRLRHNILFENVNDKDFALIRAKLAERRYKPDDVILKDEGVGGTLYFLVAGRVKVVKRAKFGYSEETLLALLHHGDCFGELELIDGRPRSSSVVALDECITYELKKDDFDHLVRECQPFTIRLMQLLSIRLRALNFHFVQQIVQSEERAVTEVDKLHQLIEAAKTVNSTLDLDKLPTVILDTALRIVNGDRGTLYLIDEEKRELWSKVLKGSELVEIRLQIGKGIAGYVAGTGDTLNIPDAYLDSRFNPEFDEKTGYHTHTILCMPMRNNTNKIIGVIQLLNKADGLFTADDEDFINALSIHSSIAIENARLYEQERQKIALEKDILAAKEVQLSLLPKSAPKIPGYDIAGKSISALHVGGDYFDFIPMDETRTALCLGDISGKGLPAALLMANLQATLRGQAMPELTPKTLIRRANRLLYQNTTSDKFMTLFFSILDTRDNTLSYTNAGHDHPFLISPDGKIERLKTGGLVVSIVEDFPYDEDVRTMTIGSTLIVNSDGITEALNSQREQFGEKRLADVFNKHLHRSSLEILDEILVAVKEFTGTYPQFDDETLLVVKRVS